MNNEKSTAELLQMYANARTTCHCSGGHYKASRNEALYYEYAMELRERGVIVPCNLEEITDKDFKPSVIINGGVFNGIGSF